MWTDLFSPLWSFFSRQRREARRQQALARRRAMRDLDIYLKRRTK